VQAMAWKGVPCTPNTTCEFYSDFMSTTSLRKSCLQNLEQAHPIRVCNVSAATETSQAASTSVKRRCQKGHNTQRSHPHWHPLELAQVLEGLAFLKDDPPCCCPGRSVRRR
jgi:hypothetical protein